jgi:acyl-CoA dehydrogenase
MTDLLDVFASGLSEEDDTVRRERLRVRTFLDQADATGLLRSEPDSWLSAFSAEFSAAMGAAGWIGMTWPVEYGGRALSNRVRFAVIEEFLSAGAPMAAHWFGDRQVGPSLLRNGSDRLRQRFLPRIAAGQLFFSIGMSEPESGSDLGSVRTRAVRADGGWRVSGSKVWTSHADRTHLILALVRTGSVTDRPSTALTQLIIDLAAPGVEVRPIVMLDGDSHFCEVFLDDVFVPDEMVLGEVGQGWSQVLGELAYERSGPERFLSAFPLLRRFLAAVDRGPDRPWAADLGRIVSRMVVARAMSERTNAQLDLGHAPGVAAALVKDVGTRLENDTIEMVRAWRPEATEALRAELDVAQARAPGFTLRGGTSEILRGIVARELGLS